MKKLLVLLLLIPTLVFSQKPSDYKHNSDKWVDDFEDIYTPAQEEQLATLIKNFFDTTQIALVTIPTFGDYDPSDFATELGRQWGVGSKSNNGLMIVISKGDRKMFAATGYGIEGVLPDITTTQLQHDLAIPHFKNGDYFQGTYDLLKGYIAELNGSAARDRAIAKELYDKQEAVAAEERAKAWENAKGVLWNVLFGGLIIAGFIALFIHLRKRARLRAAYMEDLKTRTINAKREMNRLVNLGIHAAEIGCKAEGDALIKKIKEYGLDPEQEIISENGYLNFIHKYNEIDKLTQQLEDDITTKSRLYKSGLSVLKSNTPITIHTDNAKSAIQALDTLQLDNADKYKGIVKEIGLLEQALGLAITGLTKQLDDRNWGSIQGATNKVDMTVRDIMSRVTQLRNVVSIDQEKVSLAKNAKRNVQTKLKDLADYIGKAGTKTSTNTITEKNIKSVESDLVRFSNDLENNLALYSLFTQRMEEQCTGARDEHKAYLAEQQRLREEEEERIRRKKRQEEDERRRKREEEEADARRRSSYSSSYSSDSSSSSSGSSFGGGSFGGGGGGSSW